MGRIVYRRELLIDSEPAGEDAALSRVLGKEHEESSRSTQSAPLFADTPCSDKRVSYNLALAESSEVIALRKIERCPRKQK
jgi:hypothetical protein